MRGRSLCINEDGKPPPPFFFFYVRWNMLWSSLESSPAQHEGPPVGGKKTQKVNSRLEICIAPD